MWEISSALIDDAKRIAAEMLITGDTIRSVPFGKSGDDSIVVSRDKNLVEFLAYFDVDGTTFYFGDRKK